jgi:hypothetical protein
MVAEYGDALRRREESKRSPDRLERRVSVNCSSFVFFPLTAKLFHCIDSWSSKRARCPSTSMSSSSATGASSRSPSPATPDASDNLQHIVVEDEDYPWLASSPIGPRLTSWDGKPTPHVDEARSVPALSLQDLIHDSAFEECVSYCALSVYHDSEFLPQVDIAHRQCKLKATRLARWSSSDTSISIRP